MIDFLHDDMMLHVCNDRLSRFVERAMIKSGLSPHYRGFTYLRNCVLYNMARSDNNSFANLYYYVAAYVQLPVSVVTKSIRSLCEYKQDILYNSIPAFFDFSPVQIMDTQKLRKLPVEPPFVIFALTLYVLLLYAPHGELYPSLPDYAAVGAQNKSLTDYLLKTKDAIFKENYMLNKDIFRNRKYPAKPIADPEIVSINNKESFFTMDEYKSDLTIYKDLFGSLLNVYCI